MSNHHRPEPQHRRFSKGYTPQRRIHIPRIDGGALTGDGRPAELTRICKIKRTLHATTRKHTPQTNIPEREHTVSDPAQGAYLVVNPLLLATLSLQDNVIHVVGVGVVNENPPTTWTHRDNPITVHMAILPIYLFDKTKTNKSIPSRPSKHIRYIPLRLYFFFPVSSDWIIRLPRHIKSEINRFSSLTPQTSHTTTKIDIKLYTRISARIPY